jgi:hypothetical protein
MARKSEASHAEKNRKKPVKKRDSRPSKNLIDPGVKITQIDHAVNLSCTSCFFKSHCKKGNGIIECVPEFDFI